MSGRSWGRHGFSFGLSRQGEREVKNLQCWGYGKTAAVAIRSAGVGELAVTWKFIVRVNFCGIARQGFDGKTITFPRNRFFIKLYD